MRHLSVKTYFEAIECSAECGGGQRRREVMCFSEGAHVDSSHCDANQRPAIHEDCNNQPCDEDNLLIVGGCRGTRHGCCPDGLVAAEGPNYLGCPARDPIPRGACIEMDFGCCLDGITPAQGPFLYGCPKYTCQDTEHGCCSDGQTAAKGNDGEGCPDRIYGCDRYGYGCCPDGKTSATGPNYEGCPSRTPVGIQVHPQRKEDKAEEIDGSGEPCETGDCNVIVTGCSSSLYGCCQDGRTAASGPDYLGCPGPKSLASPCASTAYGCCPDGVTPALGADNEGCDDAGSGEVEADCRASTYGCCPDGSTAAQGPSYEGCDADCDAMAYGCCPDGIKAAEGPNFLGCVEAEVRVSEAGCADDKYGCCPDGKTAALGPKNAGCPSVIAKRAECGLPHERGPCSNYTVRWAFDASYGECSRFWYGGCEGNGNNFETKEECRKGCVHPEEEIEMCYLPKSVGRCRASVMRYYYNVKTHQCEEFSYGGCLGNGNRFETQEVCETRCVAPHTPDVCNQPKKIGQCRGHFPRWFYDHADGACKQFVYGGCQGNDNRFSSKEACEQRCVSPATTVCLLNKDPGPCQVFFKNWYFDAASEECVEFVYGGCGGNNNRFATKDECKNTCRELLKKKKIDICTLPKETGPCTAYFERWYYDKSDEYCKMFVYGGCQGNKNRFVTEQECRSQCRAKGNQWVSGNTSGSGQSVNCVWSTDVCTLTKAVGSCSSAIQRYFFNTDSATCEQFLYSGCGGNGNSFDTLEECEKSCDKHLRKFVVSKGKEHCYQPVAAGPCLNSMSRYHYNSVSGECEEFQYGGCGGNRNRFLNKQQCEDECRNSTTPAPTALPTTPENCSLHYNPGPCKNFSVLWYFDILEGRCRDFLYGGCKGNENKFLTREECEQECTSEPDVTCTLNYDGGDCFAYIPMFYYDSEKGACVQFIYGGCGGNANRFKTREACEQRCQPKTMHSVTSGLSKCALPKEAGQCDGVHQLSVTKWYYNMEAGQCEKFIYSLCGGNENRFKSKTECEEACPVADICHQEFVTGPCRASKRRYHFDAATGKCNEFTYGGCNGNANRFLKLESCESACQQFASITTAVPAITTELETCSKPREAGECHTYTLRWYHDKMQEQCSQFVYSGCGGNDNNFQTEEECQRRCFSDQDTVATTTVAAPTTTEAPGKCTLPKETGKCEGFAQLSVTRWYYNTEAGQCEQFVYSLCGGNENRFPSKEACEEECVQPAAIVEEPEEKTDSSGDDDDFDICQLKQDMGTCYNYQIKWFYDASISRCRRFYYGSCGGNGNRFETREECVQMCVERKVKPKLGVVEKACKLDPEVGPCNDTIDRWFYNTSSDHCELFVYGGCHGNGNNFEEESQCAAACGQKILTEINDECMAPVDIGPCKAAVVRWYYDPEDRSCKDFVFGGCDGNTNNFATKEKCERTCTKFVAEGFNHLL
ncbi:hypothetical protein NP493_46g01054 [Ridgeia piscesae]|uniref:BPTI/Kunitz inhibitor domain-containing protein n=1 Tax=Ridgeia piscesae TaxID=27915 RepID=A0AAD9UJP3_RIDPI|nr:hypothetical protein NP493_46g01054 [Ridgeia piscesae]